VVVLLLQVFGMTEILGTCEDICLVCFGKRAI
jgi:hypothetical protein